MGKVKECFNFNIVSLRYNNDDDHNELFFRNSWPAKTLFPASATVMCSN